MITSGLGCLTLVEKDYEFSEDNADFKDHLRKLLAFLFFFFPFPPNSVSGNKRLELQGMYCHEENAYSVKCFMQHIWR